LSEGTDWDIDLILFGKGRYTNRGSYIGKVGYRSTAGDIHIESRYMLSDFILENISNDKGEQREESVCRGEDKESNV
jgi:hypothetical protein